MAVERSFSLNFRPVGLSVIKVCSAKKSRALSVGYGNGFHFAENLLGERFHRNAGACRFTDEILLIHCVESGKVIHVGKEAGCLDNLGEIHAGCLENGAEIRAALLCLSFNGCSDDFTGCGVQRNLTGSKEETVDCICLGLRADCCGCIFCCDNFHVFPSPFVIFRILNPRQAGVIP